MEPVPGTGVRLTIDADLQGVAQDAIARQVEASSADYGMVVAMGSAQLVVSTVEGAFSVLVEDLVVTATVTLSIGQGMRLVIDRGFGDGSSAVLVESIGVFAVLVVLLIVFLWAGVKIRRMFAGAKAKLSKRPENS